MRFKRVVGAQCYLYDLWPRFYVVIVRDESDRSGKMVPVDTWPIKMKYSHKKLFL